MSTTLPRIPKLKPDLVAATPDGGAWRSENGLETEYSSYYRFMKAKDPLYYNSLADKHATKYIQKPVVKKHLNTMGLTAVDGTVYPTREEQIEANRINRLYEERQDMLCKLVMREQSHLRHLRRSARAGELMFTKNGVFETNPCDDCHVYHKVTSHLPNKSLCPSSSLGRRQEKEREAKRLLTRRQRNCVSARASRLQSAHVHTKTSRMDRVTTQTAKREPPHRSTYISRRNIPEMGVHTSESASSVSESSSCMPRYTSSDIWSESSTDTLLREMSYSDHDFDSGLELIHHLSLKNRELDNELCEQMLKLEKDALEEIWQKFTEKYTVDFQTVERLKAEVTKCEFKEQNKLDKSKVEYSRELKCNTALEAILKALDNEQNRVNASMKKQKAADKLINERCNMDELVAEQIKFNMKVPALKLDEEFEEQRGVLISAGNKAKRKVKLELAGKQADAQITSYRLGSHVVRQVHSTGVLSRQNRQELPQIGSNNFIPMNPTEIDVIRTVQTLQQIKRDMNGMFPQIENILKKRISDCFSPYTNVPSRESQVEKLPMAAPQEEQCSTHIENECSCTADASKYDSASTLGSTLQEAESSDDGGTSEPENTSTTSNEENTDAFTTNCISEKLPSLNFEEEEFTPTSIPRVPTPPVYPRPAGYALRGVISCQSSLRQIKENSASDFTNEFVSPLAVHSQAVVPYHSQRTQLGITDHMEMDRKQFYEERLIRSRDELIKQEEQIRKSMKELIPPKRTLSEFYAAEAEGNPMPAPTLEVTPVVSETCLQLETTAFTEESIGIPRTDIENKTDKPLVDKYLETASTCMSSAKSLTLSIINASIAKAEGNPMPAPTLEVTPVVSETCLQLETTAFTEESIGIPRTDIEKKTDKPLVDKYLETASTYMSSAKSLTLSIINASIAKLNAKAQSASHPEMPSADTEMESETVESLLRTEEVSSIQKTASSASTKSAKKGSSVSLKETVTASVPKITSVASTKSSKGSKASLNEKVTAENVSVPKISSAAPKSLLTKSVAPVEPGQCSCGSYARSLKMKYSTSIVQKKKSTVSITPSEVSVESYMKPLSSKTFEEAPTTIRSPTESMKSLGPRPQRLSLSFKSLLDLLPSKLSAIMSKNSSKSNNDVFPLGSTSSIHSS